ncbi:hypothetical protein BK809_0003723 [Diplodia seriata]|uniref:Heterokaryon incompatibility domain-containing protein n=1 Tax=Diplodia seriata TaxID=420778 RepID=A0A1S8BGY3_9PEZI|nr:hypothetical protein BK809_0003723 [Diplodia seriata]
MRYLWIDSLCIIQDDQTDWETESQKISSIFKNAQITIIAASAPDPKTPILTERPQHAEAAAFEFPERDGSHSFLYSRPVTPADTFHWPPAQQPPKGSGGARRSPQEEEQAIYTRSWALQEHLLAPRAIHYQPNRVLWTCKTPRRHHHKHRDERQHLLPLPRKTSTTRQKPPLAHHHTVSRDKWWHYVAASTARELARPSDKLPAISAIASAIAAQQQNSAVDDDGDEYLAGLWRRSLVADLGWRNESNRYRCSSSISSIGSNGSIIGSSNKRHVRSPGEEEEEEEEGKEEETPPYLAPTWSWASLATTATAQQPPGSRRRQVITNEAAAATAAASATAAAGKLSKRQNDDDDDKNNEIFRFFTAAVDAAVTLAGPNRFGAVRDGFVTLRGPLLPLRGEEVVRLVWDGRAAASLASSSASFTPDAALCVGRGVLETGEEVATVCRGYSSGEELGGEECPGVVVHVLLLFETWEDAVGLVLGRSRRVRGAYERLGRMQIRRRGLKAVMQAAVESTVTIV